MTAAPTHSSISLEVKQGNPEVSTAPVVLRRSERLVTKPKVDYRQVALLPRWPTSTAVSSNSCPGPTLYPSSSFAALQQHANPSAFETVPATLVERGRNVTIGTRSGVGVRISEDGLGQGREIVEEIELDSDEEFNTALDIETLPRTYDLEYKNVGRGNLTGNGPDFINESGVVRTEIRSPRPTLPHATSAVRSQSEPRMSHQVADRSTSVLLGRPQPTTVRPVGVSERREDAPHTPRYMGNAMPHPTRPAFLLESQAPATCCHSGCRSNLPMSSFAFASTPYSYPGAQSTLGRPTPDSVPRTFRETAVGNGVEWTIANGRGLGQNACSGAQRYGWKREPYCPPYQTTPWVRSNDTQVKTVVMTSVATQTTGDEEVIVKSEGAPAPKANKPDSTATTGIEKESESANLPSRPKQFIKLGSYDGRKQVEAFIRKFTICGKNNGWTDEEKLNQLMCALVEPASQILWESEAGTLDTWSDLVEWLMTRYGSADQAALCQTQLCTRKQQVGEELSSLVQDIRRLMTLAYPGPPSAHSESLLSDRSSMLWLIRRCLQRSENGNQNLWTTRIK